MKKIMMILMAAALVALPTKAQSFGEQEQPTSAFQSTSTMTPTGSAYSANPSLNADGLATAPVAQGPTRAGGGPKKSLGLPDETPTPDASDKGNLPIGDAVLPLMIMALAFGGVIYYRRRKALKC